MDDDLPKPSLTLNEATMAQLRRSAARDRRITEDDALNRIQPSLSETAEAVWLGEGGRAAGDRPLLPLIPKR